MLFLNRAKEDFNIKPIESPKTERFITECGRMYEGKPDWLDDNVITVNFAKAICSEVARLTTLGIEITAESTNAMRQEYIQRQIDKVFFQLRHWIEYGCAYGTVILKPSMDVIQVVTPDRFMITEEVNGEIRGVVFHDQVPSLDKKKYYNRLEYHRFLENGHYAVSSRFYIGETPNDSGKAVGIEETPWRGMLEEVELENVNGTLFGVFRTPQANNIEMGSPLSLPIFADAIEELKDLDIAYSRNVGEIADSEKFVLMDSDRMFAQGNYKNIVQSFERTRESMKLPHYVRQVQGDGDSNFYQEINPTLQTSIRLEGINSLLSQIGYKCGFSNGYFVFNEQTGFATATQIEADEQRTIQLIGDVRAKLEKAFDELVYAMSVFADLYGLAPAGETNLVYNFKDITQNTEEDRQRWWTYVQSGKVPAWLYFVKFEGMAEDEARALGEEMKAEQQEQLFKEE